MGPGVHATVGTSERASTQPKNGAAVTARGLTKHFRELVAVDGIDLDIPRGVCFGLLGPNGAGKTTAISMIQCTSPVSAGDLHVLGMDAKRDRRNIKARLGLVPQEDNLDPDFTVAYNLRVYARYFGIDRETADQRTQTMLEFMQLGEKRDARIDQLSGGMKRRLVVARALMNDPELLILDEPPTGLDPQARHTIWDKVRALRHEGKTILLTTHYMDEAEILCDHIVIIDKGRILAEASPRALIEKHTGREAVEFVVAHEATGVLEQIVAELTTSDVRHEVLSDRVIAFAANAEALQEDIRSRFDIHESILRRATLEDVFLRLTGRALRD